MRYFALIAVMLFGTIAFATPTAITAKALTETPVLIGPVAVDVSNGNSVSNLAENVVLYFKNTYGTSTATATVTVQQPSLTIPGVGPVTKSSVVVSLGNSAEYIVGPFPAQSFNDTNGNLQITYGGVDPNGLQVTAMASVKLMKIP